MYPNSDTLVFNDCCWLVHSALEKDNFTQCRIILDLVAKEKKEIEKAVDQEALQTVDAIVNQLKNSYDTKLREKNVQVIPVRRNLKRKTPPTDTLDLSEETKRIKSQMRKGSPSLAKQTM